MSRVFRVRELAERIGGSVLGDPERVIRGVGSLAGAGPDDITFIDAERHAPALARSRAAAVIVPQSVEPPRGMSGIMVEAPLAAMARVMDLLHPAVRSFDGVSASAVLGREVSVGAGVGIGPLAFVGDRVRIGARTEIHPAATIAHDCDIGEDCTIHSGVHLYPGTTLGHRVTLHAGVVIGADGFGYVRERLLEGSADEPERHRKIPQLGRVVIEDDVEIGANSTVDRATFEETRIGRGTKIDNLVTVGHNCRVGRHCVVVGQAGISGSTVIGDYVAIAGQAGLTGHLRIGDRAVIGSQAGVTKNVPDGEVVLGSPAVEVGRARRALPLVYRLPEFMKTLNDYGRRLARLEAATGRPVDSKT